MSGGSSTTALQITAVRRWTAYHEAGHAVLRIVRAGHATQIDIGADGRGYSHGSGEEIRETDSIEVALAGPLAEARHRKVSLFYVLCTAGQEDWELASSIAAKFAARFAALPNLKMNKASVLEEAEANARRYLRMHWPSVERLAQAATVRGTLTSMEVGQIAAID